MCDQINVALVSKRDYFKNIKKKKKKNLTNPQLLTSGLFEEF